MWRARFVAVGLLSLGSTSCSDSELRNDEPPPSEITTPLSANDVSILFPLPAPALRTELLGPHSAGARGALLPPETYALLPRLQNFIDNADTYASLRVVSLRLDPCFPTLDRDTRDAGGCMPQVRAVLQPLTLADRDGTTYLLALDAAVHTFYELTDDELDLLLRYIAEARGEVSPHEVLSPHPRLVTEGPNGEFGSVLKRRVLELCGSKNLRRVTFMTSESFGDTWRFGGFDLTDSGPVRMTVATLPSTDQVFLNLDLEGVGFETGASSPPVTSSDDLSLLFDSSAAVAASPDALAAALAAADRIENPELHRPDTIDCVSCHVAAPAKAWALRELSISSEPGFTDELGQLIVGSTTIRSDELRAFGYFDDRASVSQRVVNETFAVVRYLERERNITR